MNTESGRRRYESARRAAQAQQTKAEIADAARRLFVSRGWAATTVRDVAREAGVSIGTVYAAYGNKTGLTAALIDAAALSADVPQMIAELDAAAGDPHGHLAALVAFDRRLFERAGDLIALVRDAGRTQPELADAYRDARRRAAVTLSEVFSSWPAGTLRGDLDVVGAADIYAAMCNIDVYVTLTSERGWPADRVQRWWSDVLARELLADRHQ